MDLSAAVYRSWLTWDWGQIVRDTIEDPRALHCMMMQVAALGATFVAFGITLAESQSTSPHTETLVSSLGRCLRLILTGQIISYGFVLLDLAMLVLSTRRLRCRYATAVKETRISLVAHNSTASLTVRFAEGSRRQWIQKGSEQIPDKDSSDREVEEDQTVICEDTFGVEFTVKTVV